MIAEAPTCPECGSKHVEDDNEEDQRCTECGAVFPIVLDDETPETAPTEPAPPACRIGWIDCRGDATFHDAPAVAIAVLAHDDGTTFERPICAEHLDTLNARKPHHDRACGHTSRTPSHWYSKPLTKETPP